MQRVDHSGTTSRDIRDYLFYQLEGGNAVEVFRVRGKRLCFFHTMLAEDGG